MLSALNTNKNTKESFSLVIMPHNGSLSYQYLYIKRIYIRLMHFCCIHTSMIIILQLQNVPFVLLIEPIGGLKYTTPASLVSARTTQHSQGRRSRIEKVKRSFKATESAIMGAKKRQVSNDQTARSFNGGSW